MQPRDDLNREIEEMAYTFLPEFQRVYEQVLGPCPEQENRAAYLDWHKRRVAVSVASRALGEMSLCWCDRTAVRDFVREKGEELYQTAVFLVGQGRTALPEA